MASDDPPRGLSRRQQNKQNALGETSVARWEHSKPLAYLSPPPPVCSGLSMKKTLTMSFAAVFPAVIN